MAKTVPSDRADGAAEIMITDATGRSVEWGTLEDGYPLPTGDDGDLLVWDSGGWVLLEPGAEGEFLTIVAGVPAWAEQPVGDRFYSGIALLADEQDEITIMLPASNSSNLYPVVVSLQKDSADPHIDIAVTSKAVNSFVVQLAGETTTSNYRINWFARIQ